MADEVSAEARKQHWARSRRLTILVLVIWFLFGYVIPWNAQALNAGSFLGFPLGYYFCVQGSLAMFVVLIFFQNFMQDRIDADLGVTYEDESNEVLDTDTADEVVATQQDPAAHPEMAAKLAADDAMRSTLDGNTESPATEAATPPEAKQ